MDVRRFRAVLYELAARARSGDDQEVRSQVFGIADILVEFYRKNLGKINHSALEPVCARGLVKRGYDVEVEHSHPDQGLYRNQRPKGRGFTFGEAAT